jgi:hypothetical protein
MPPCERLRPGDVLLVFCRFIKPPKNKYALCIYASEKPLFFFINSEPRTSKPEAQLAISTTHLPCLSHDSFVNAGQAVTFPHSDLKGAVLKGHIPDSKKAELVALVSASRYLPQIQKQKIIDSFK